MRDRERRGWERPSSLGTKNEAVDVRWPDARNAHATALRYPTVKQDKQSTVRGPCTAPYLLAPSSHTSVWTSIISLLDECALARHLWLHPGAASEDGLARRRWQCLLLHPPAFHCSLALVARRPCTRILPRELHFVCHAISFKVAS